MLDNMQLWIFGTAALIDSVLLFSLMERHNRRAVTVWMFLLASGACFWHAGNFTWHLVSKSLGPFSDPMRWFSMLMMAVGLMTMPSAALHGTVRLFRHGQFQLGPKLDPRLALCYLPMVLLVPMARALAADPAKRFVDLLADYRIPYVVWLCLVSAMTSYVLCLTALGSNDKPTRRFYYMLATSMVLISGLTTIYVVTLDHIPGLQTVVALLPMIPSVLFAYFVMRFQLLPFVLERTLVWGALLMGGVLFHQVAIRPYILPIEDRYRVDLRVVEGGLVFVGILLYQPLRRRVAAALESLLESSEARRREQQRLAVDLATHAGDPPARLLDWFVTATRRSFGTDFGAGWLCDRQGGIIERAGSFEVLNESQVWPMHLAMARTESRFVTRSTAADPVIIEFIDGVRAGALLRFEHAEISGLFLIGCRKWGQPLSNEDLLALALLVEQLGVTLHNSRLMALQVAAEQRFFQQQRLSTLGLIASSLAHEIKNPLSTIKTITQVLREDLGPDSQYAEDLRMIGVEIERLASSTTELLSVARPTQKNQLTAPVLEHLLPTLRLLKYLARERGAALEVTFPEQPIIISIDQTGLREIVFNLISNAVDAVGPDGRVQFVCRREEKSFVLEIHDSGPGLSETQKRHLFEPFFTTKEAGTGLGLYVVARRVRELGGKIECQSVFNHGTKFVVTLPSS